MEWEWPQYAYAATLVGTLSFHLYQDGQSDKGWTGVSASIAVFCIHAGILSAGGFWG